MKYDRWTVNDEGVANNQGWTLTKYSRETEIIELRKLHRVNVFTTDEDAWLHVYNSFLAGDKVCKKALMILAEENREEFLRIKEHGEMSNTETKIE